MELLRKRAIEGVSVMSVNRDDGIKTINMVYWIQCGLCGWYFVDKREAWEHIEYCDGKGLS